MMEELISLNETLDTQVFYGVNNRNMLCLRNLFPQVRIVARGTQVKASGPEDELRRFADTLRRAEAFCIDHGTLTERQLIDLIEGNRPQEQQPDNLILYGQQGKPILARTGHQQQLVRDFRTCDLLFAIGPAGSGKTYTAIALAVKALKNREVKRIILSRPAVEAGEKLGFLPGDMKEKIDPYLQPLYDALQEMLPAQKLGEYMEKGIIQIAPLAFMRGRTLGNAVVILDEAQNTSIQQIKMFLTRLGIGGKMIVTGDLTQVDLPAAQKSGLRDAVEVLQGVEGVSVVNFSEKDIVRHPLVTRILKAYDKQA
ncbi:MAG: PhoH family protein [Paludibacteraceae bacterium]|nr:PhoH family protein [Paludibacteraceae bacterium]